MLNAKKVGLISLAKKDYSLWFFKSVLQDSLEQTANHTKAIDTKQLK